MKHFFPNILRHGLLPVLAVLCAGACEKPSSGTEADASPVRFIIGVEGPEGLPATRTLLTAPDMEMKVTDVTLAAYSGGKLAASGYYTTGFSTMNLSLARGWTFNVYALANMGDLREALPADETALPALTYAIPAYTGTERAILTAGIPMAGMKEGFTAGSAGSPVVPVKRLLAKVTVNVSCTWPDPQVRSVEVHNLNRTLKPFGTSVLSSDGDRLDGTVERSVSDTPGPAFSAVLYVPENLQGTVPGIPDTFSRSGDGNSTVSGKAGVLTYIETRVDASGTPYSGEVTYRSYLGGNATTDFNIRRNCTYVWDITYTEDGLQYNDWKHGTDGLQGVRYRYAAVPSSLSLKVGGSSTWQVVRYEDRYEAGTWTEGTAASCLTANQFSFTTGSLSIAGSEILGTDTVLTKGTAVGQTTITITVHDGLSEGRTLTLPVTVAINSGSGGIDSGWDDGGETGLD